VGRSLITASLDSDKQSQAKVHSDEVTAISFAPLESHLPSYDSVLGDLWAPNMTERELKRMTQLYPSRDRSEFSLTYGAAFLWQLVGGGKHL
jgi:hypothetical protein